jgi:hypothetical protein
MTYHYFHQELEEKMKKKEQELQDIVQSYEDILEERKEIIENLIDRIWFLETPSYYLDNQKFIKIISMTSPYTYNIFLNRITVQLLLNETKDLFDMSPKEFKEYQEKIRLEICHLEVARFPKELDRINEQIKIAKKKKDLYNGDA